MIAGPEELFKSCYGRDLSHLIEIGLVCNLKKLSGDTGPYLICSAGLGLGSGNNLTKNSRPSKRKTGGAELDHP